MVSYSILYWFVYTWDSFSRFPRYSMTRASKSGNVCKPCISLKLAREKNIENTTYIVEILFA